MCQYTLLQSLVRCSLCICKEILFQKIQLSVCVSMSVRVWRVYVCVCVCEQPISLACAKLQPLERYFNNPKLGNFGNWETSCNKLFYSAVTTQTHLWVRLWALTLTQTLRQAHTHTHFICSTFHTPQLDSITTLPCWGHPAPTELYQVLTLTSGNDGCSFSY